MHRKQEELYWMILFVHEMSDKDVPAPSPGHLTTMVVFSVEKNPVKWSFALGKDAKLEIAHFHMKHNFTKC